MWVSPGTGEKGFAVRPGLRRAVRRGNKMQIIVRAASVHLTNVDQICSAEKSLSGCLGLCLLVECARDHDGKC